MADNVLLPLSGVGDATASVATDDVGGNHYQFMKMVDGALGNTNPVRALGTDPAGTDVGLVVRPIMPVSTGSIGAVSLLAGSSANMLGAVAQGAGSTSVSPWYVYSTAGGAGSTAVDANLTSVGSTKVVGTVNVSSGAILGAGSTANVIGSVILGTAGSTANTAGSVALLAGSTANVVGAVAVSSGAILGAGSSGNILGSVTLAAGTTANVLGSVILGTAGSTANTIGSAALLAGSTANVVGAVAVSSGVVLGAGSSANILGSVTLAAGTSGNIVGSVVNAAGSTGAMIGAVIIGTAGSTANPVGSVALLAGSTANTVGAVAQGAGGTTSVDPWFVNSPIFSSANTSRTSVSTTVDTQLVAASSRRAMIIANRSTSQIVGIGFSTGAVTTGLANVDLFLPANSYVFFGAAAGLPNYGGPMRGINISSTTVAGSVAVTQFF